MNWLGNPIGEEMIMLRTLAFAAAMGIAAAAAQAETHEVKMLSSGEGGLMVFEPDYLHIEPGDTVTFVPVDPSHNAESIPEIMPEGAEPFKGAINEEISVTFEEEGLYGVKCAPHFGLGMVALIQTGRATNLEEAQAVKLIGPAAKRMEAALAKVE